MSRPLCPRCERPLSTCLCAWRRATPNRVRVLVLQHPHEVQEAKGSTRLLQLSLAQVQVNVGEVFDPAALAAWLGAAGESVLLYPADTLGHASQCLAAHAAPAQLVVIDATWKKSLRMLAHNPLLHALPRLPLNDTAHSALSARNAASAYGQLRRAPKPGQLSTLEATCHALQALECPADPEAATRYQALLQAFDGWAGECVARAAHVVQPPRS